MDDILTVSETASYLKKSQGTVRHWITSGILKAKKISAGGSGVYVLLKTDILEWIITHPSGPDMKKRTIQTSSPQLPML